MKADTNTPEFKRWFGKSKVVDANGKPLVVYHGTKKGGFTVFKPKDEYFFTDSKEVASTYGSEIYSVFLSIRNPLVIEGEGSLWNRIPFQGDYVNTKYVSRFAKDAGYDGVIVRNIYDTDVGIGGPVSTVFIVFEPTQIKSANHNRGTFDPHDPDIRNPSLSPNQQRKYLAGLTGTERKAREAEILYRREHRSNEPFATDAGQTTQRSSHAAKFERKYGRAAADTADVAKLTGISKKILDEVYARGMAAWQTGHRPGASQHAWALARVYSFVTGGPTMRGPDADLAREAGMTRNPADTFIPPAAVAAEARRALELRASQPPSNRCCTPVGIRRASQLANRQPVSVDTLRRMKAYFDRHAIDKQGKGWAEGTSKGLQAWLAWGGDSARVWCNEVLASLDGAGHNPRGFSQKGDAMAGDYVLNIYRPTGKSALKHPATGTLAQVREIIKKAPIFYDYTAEVSKDGKVIERYACGIAGWKKQNPKSKAKTRNPSAAEHLKRGKQLLREAQGMRLQGDDKLWSADTMVIAGQAMQDLDDAQAWDLLPEATKVWGQARRALKAAKNPAKSKAKKRNPSAAEHAKRGEGGLFLAQTMLERAKRTGRKDDYLTAYTDGVEAELDAYYGADTATEKGARKVVREASIPLLKNPGKRLHNFKVLDAKGKAIALTTTLPEANKVCPKGGKVVKL